MIVVAGEALIDLVPERTSSAAAGDRLPALRARITAALGGRVGAPPADAG
ncbi:hypothetical protein B0E53_05387 [Micromonospora sp. MH33]|nr:hypothetical protein B0E53_05387 [Micromonospora sp. MH33]